MKKLRWFLTLLIVVLLIGCGSSEKEEKEVVHTEWIGSEKYVIDTENDTIVHEGDTYRYETSGNPEHYSVKIIFPDDSYFAMNYAGFGGSGSTSADFDWENNRIMALDMVDLVEQNEGIPGEKTVFNLRIGYVLLGVLFIGLGIANVRNPYFFWKWEIGWRFKDAEPSNLALTMEKIGGCISIVIGVVCLFLSFAV